jgi:hypothetical protein
MNPRLLIGFFSRLALLPVKRLSVVAVGTIMVSSITSLAPAHAYSLNTELSQGETSGKILPPGTKVAMLDVTNLPPAPVSDPMPVSGLGAILIFWTLLQHRQQKKVYPVQIIAD